MRIPEEVINEIRNRAHIEDVISNYIQIIKKGNNYVAYCPFHDDHDPSLHISTDKQIWKCFSCPSEEGSAGDVFKFVMKYKHVDYIEAVKMVADLIGYKYDFGNRNTKTFEETNYHKVIREAVNFCQHELNSKEGVAFKEYLANRAIDDKIIEKYNIGYNPKNDVLYNFLHKKGYKDEDIIKANVARLTKDGIRDVYYNRITIPIFDVDGHPIGFTARSIDPNTESKYINTSDTPIFNKSNVLFNLNHAKEYIREKKFVIVAEGPMDVIAFDKVGLYNALCSLGTSFTKQQLAIIKKHTNNILLAFDGDKAGQSAILRTGRLAIEAGFKVLALGNNTLLDPDEIVRKYGADELIKMVEKPKTWIEFIFDYYDKQYDLNNYLAKKEYCLKIMEEINKLSDQLDRDNYIHKLSEITGFSYSVLANNTKIKEVKEEKTVHKNSYANGIEIAQKTIIKQIMLNKGFVEVFKQELAQLVDEDYNQLLMSIINYYQNNDTINIAQLAGNLDSRYSSLLYEIEEDELLLKKYNREVFNDAIIAIKVYYLDKQIQEKEKHIKSLKDGIVQAKIAGEVMKLKKEKITLMNNKSGQMR